MTEDLLYGWALGLTCGLAIGLIILAAYHHHVDRLIKDEEEAWNPDYEALKLSQEFTNLAIDAAWNMHLDKNKPNADDVINLSPAQWRASQRKE